MLGLEPLYLACEGTMVIIAPKEEAEKIVEAITPVPRGVGGVTTSILLEHVVDAAIAQNR